MNALPLHKCSTCGKALAINDRGQIVGNVAVVDAAETKNQHQEIREQLKSMPRAFQDSPIGFPKPPVPLPADVERDVEAVAKQIKDVQIESAALWQNSKVYLLQTRRVGDWKLTESFRINNKGQILCRGVRNAGNTNSVCLHSLRVTEFGVYNVRSLLRRLQLSASSDGFRQNWYKKNETTRYLLLQPE